MPPRELFAILIGAIAVCFISIGAVSMLAGAVGQEFSYLIVGGSLLAVAGFVFGRIAQK